MAPCQFQSFLIRMLKFLPRRLRVSPNMERSSEIERILLLSVANFRSSNFRSSSVSNSSLRLPASIERLAFSISASVLAFASLVLARLSKWVIRLKIDCSTIVFAQP